MENEHKSKRNQVIGYILPCAGILSEASPVKVTRSHKPQLLPDSMMNVRLIFAWVSCRTTCRLPSLENKELEGI